VSAHGIPLEQHDAVPAVAAQPLGGGAPYHAAADHHHPTQPLALPRTGAITLR
jgi:hypothetical protein